MLDQARDRFAGTFGDGRGGDQPSGRYHAELVELTGADDFYEWQLAARVVTRGDWLTAPLGQRAVRHPGPAAVEVFAASPRDAGSRAEKTDLGMLLGRLSVPAVRAHAGESGLSGVALPGGIVPAGAVQQLTDALAGVDVPEPSSPGGYAYQWAQPGQPGRYYHGGCAAQLAGQVTRRAAFSELPGAPGMCSGCAQPF